jgi:hypothetical protein
MTVTAGAASAIERERAVVTGLLVLQALLWLGFAVHRSPRFPGSLSGTTLGIAGAALMVLPSLAYEAVKRVPRLRRLVTARLPLRRVLSWHVYGGVLGAMLAILHTGHRFASPLGIALTAAMLVAVFSGYIGRHFLRQVSLDLREKQALLGQLVTSYNDIAARLSTQPPPSTRAGALQSRWARLVRRIDFGPEGPDDESRTLGFRAATLAESIADLEYSIKAHELLKRRFAAWLGVHILGSLAFYGLLGMHIWASLYFGLRWLV